MNPYDKIMVSISRIREEHRNNNKLGFIGDQIVIKKKDDHYDVDCNLIMFNKHVMRMGYSLELSAKELIPKKIDMLLETYGEALIEQNKW